MGRRAGVFVLDVGHGLEQLAQQVQGLFVGPEGHRQIGFGSGARRHPAVEGGQQAPDHGQFQLLEGEGQQVLFLGDLIDPHRGGLDPDQRHIHKVADRGGRVAVAVNQFIQHVGGVGGVLDGGNPAVGLDPAGAVGDIPLGDIGVHPQVHQTFALVPLDRFAPGLGNGLVQHLHIEVIAHRLHVAVLAVAQQVAGAPDLQIPHGDAEPRAEGGELPDGGKTLLGDVREGLVPAEGEIGVGLPAAAAHPAPQLVELGQAHSVCVLDDEGVAVAHVDAGLDQGGADQDIQFPVQQLLPDRVQLLLGHLAVGDAHPGRGGHLLDFGGGGLDVVHPVVEVVDLAAPGQLLADGLGQNHLVVLQHKGLHRLTLKRRLLDGGHIPDAAHGHAEGPGNGGGRQGQHIHPDEILFQLFLVADAEPLFLVDDDQAQVVEPHVLGEEPVGAHHNVHAAGLEPPQGFLLLLGGAEPAQQLGMDREGLHPGQDGIVVLPGQQGGGGQDGALFAPHHALEGGPESHFGFAHPHVAAEQPVHGPGVLHVVFDLGGGGQLVLGLVVLKPGLKVLLPLAIRREGKALGLLAPGVELNQFLGHLLGGLLDPGPGPLPLGAPQFGQLDLVLVSRRGVAAQQVQLGDRHIQHVRAGILNLQIVLGGALDFQTLDAGIHADAVALVDHIVPRLDIGQAGQGVLVLLAALGAGVGLLHPVAAAGQDGAAGKGQTAPGGQMPRQHLHQARRGPDVPAHADGIPLVGQVPGEGGGSLGGAAVEGDGVALFHQRVQVLQQAPQFAVPAGGDVGLGVDEVLELELVHPPQEVLAQKGGQLARRHRQILHGLVQHIQTGADHPFFQQAGELLPPAVCGGLHGVPDAAHLVQNQKGTVHVIQQGGGGGVAQAIVFVHGLGHLAGVQLGQVGGHGSFQGGTVLAPGLFDRLPQGGGGLLAAAEQHLPGGGEVDFFQGGIPPLAHQVKGGDGANFLVPELQTGGGLHVGRVDVHDVAPDTELARAFHLGPADIAGGEQPLDQRVPGKGHPRLEGQGVGHEFGPGNGVLGQGLGGNTDGLEPSARQAAQHRQPAVFVFPAGALHRPEHEIPRGKDGGGDAQGFQVVGKVGGLGLAGGHNAERMPQVPGQQGIDQHPPGGGQTKEGRRPRGSEAGGNFLIFSGLLQQCLVHADSFLRKARAGLPVRGRRRICPPCHPKIRRGRRRCWPARPAGTGNAVRVPAGSPVVFVLGLAQLAGHDETGGGLDVGVPALHGPGVLLRKMAQHPVGQIVVGPGLFPHPDPNPGELVGAQPGDDAFQAVVAAGRAGGTNPQLAGGLGDVVAENDDMVGRNLEKSGQGRNGIPREIHIGQGLQEADLVPVDLSLSPQTLKFCLGHRHPPLVRQVIQGGKAGVVTGSVVFGLGIAEARDQPDIICYHKPVALVLCVVFSQTNREGRTAGAQPCSSVSGMWVDGRSVLPGLFLGPLLVLQILLFLDVGLHLGDGPVLQVGLAVPGDAQSPGGHVLGDGAAGGGVGAVSHRDRGHQVGVAADEAVIPDGGAEFGLAVIVAGDGAAAEIAVFAHIAVPDVGQMADRIAPGQVGIFGLHIGSQVDAVVGDGASPHMGEGPDGVMGADLGGVDLAGIDGGAGADLAVLDEGVGPDDTAGADHRPAPQDGAGEDSGPRSNLDRLVNADGPAVNQNAVGHVPQQNGLPGSLGRVEGVAHGLDGIFHKTGPPYKQTCKIVCRLCGGMDQENRPQS